MAEIGERSTGELLKELTERSAELARKEVELAKVEMELKAKRLGQGAGALGGAGLIGVFAFGVLTAALILLIATAIDDWLAALIVAVVYAAVAGVLALVGRKRVDEGTPPLPEQAIESTKADVQEAQQRVQEARR